MSETTVRGLNKLLIELLNEQVQDERARDEWNYGHDPWNKEEHDTWRLDFVEKQEGGLTWQTPCTVPEYCRPSRFERACRVVRKALKDRGLKCSEADLREYLTALKLCGFTPDNLPEYLKGNVTPGSKEPLDDWLTDTKLDGEPHEVAVALRVETLAHALQCLDAEGLTAKLCHKLGLEVVPEYETAPDPPATVSPRAGDSPERPAQTPIASVAGPALMPTTTPAAGRPDPSLRPEPSSGAEVPRIGGVDQDSSTGTTSPENSPVFVDAAALAQKHQVHPDRREAFIRQLRRNHIRLGDDFQEVTDRKPNRPLYMYNVGSHAIRQLAANYQRSKRPDNCPTTVRPRNF